MIPLAELEGETYLEFNELDAAELKLKSNVVKKFKQINAKVKISNSAIGIGADFEVYFIADLLCARCLDAFSRDFKANVYFNYVKGKDPYTNVEKVKLAVSDADNIYYIGSRIDLSVGIREAIVLSVPIALLCKDNCRGLCPVCGKNKNKEKCDCKTEKAGLFTLIPKKEKGKAKRVKKR